MPECCLIEDLLRYVGRTVTIFTTSGGLSGSGFTGVLAGVCGDCVRLITDIGAAPACPVGCSCTGPGNCSTYGFPSYGFGGGCGCGCGGGCGGGCGFGGFFGGNALGSITEIPISRIACFTHSAI